MEHPLNLSDKKYTFLEKKRNVKEMLQLYIYDYMIKRDHPEAANIIAEMAGIDISELAGYDEILVEDWWAMFWPQYKSSAQELPSHEVALAPHSSNWRWLQLYIYGYLMKRELLELAYKFADKLNFKLSELVNYDENLLEDMWTLFWPQYCSVMTDQTGGNPHSSTQNVVRQPPPPPPPPEGMFQPPPENSQRRAGKRPLDIDTDTILGLTKKGKGLLGFPPVKLHPSEVTFVPHSTNFGNLQMPGTIQAPLQLVEVDHSVRVQPTYQPGQNLAFPPTTPITGENTRNDQGSSAGDRVNAPDGSRPRSVRNQIPVAYFEMMQQEAEERRRRGN